MSHPGSFDQLYTRLRTDERVVITREEGTVEGRLRRLSAQEISIARGKSELKIPCESIKRIQKPADRLWNGALIGGAIAVLPAWNGCQNKGPNRPCVALAIGIYAGIGALFDRANGRTQTVYIAAPGSCGAETTGQSRDELLDALVARGNQLLRAGQFDQASTALRVARLFDPTHARVNEGIADLPKDIIVSLTSAEREMAHEASSGIEPQDVCGFPDLTPEMELINLRMLTDRRLVPSFRVSSLTFAEGPCSGTVSMLLARPALSVDEVRLLFGPPQSERKRPAGEVLTYGRIRVVGGSEGPANVVLLLWSR
jgi:hypothetical protein